MPELLLKIGDSGTWRDGDVIEAITARRIRFTHAWHCCHPRKMARTGDGLVPAGSLADKFCGLLFTYKFVRLSHTEVERIHLPTMAADRITATPNAAGEAMDVPQHIAHLTGSHKLFGLPGAEHWYGGRMRMTGPVSQSIWDMLETDSPHRRQPAWRWPFGDADLRVHLGVRLDSLSEEQAAELMEPELELDGNGDPVIDVDERGRSRKRRKGHRRHRVDWEAEGLPAVLAATAARIRNQSLAVGSRITMYGIPAWRSKAHADQPRTIVRDKHKRG